MAELWGAVVISVLFWTHANDVCTVEEAKVCIVQGLCVMCVQWRKPRHRSVCIGVRA